MGFNHRKLETVLQHAKLVSPSPIALQVVNTASSPSCTTSEIAALLAQDPVLCAKVLKAVNSCIFGACAQPVATIERAVVMLGLNPLRSLVLGLSLPIAQARPNETPATQTFWVNAVCGGILAKEFSECRRGIAPGYDLVAGLLRNLGFLLMLYDYPEGWVRLQDLSSHDLLMNTCRVEDEIFGINHIDVTTALLRSWKLPDDIVEPIQYHHSSQDYQTPKKSYRDRAELLGFIELVVHLDTVVESPQLLKRLLTNAVVLFGFNQERLVDFLTQISPKIDDAKRLFDIGTQHLDYSGLLARAAEALVHLSVSAQSNVHLLVPPRNEVKDPKASLDAPALPSRQRDIHATHSHVQQHTSHFSADSLSSGRPQLPPFTMTMITRFPNTGCMLNSFELRSELGRGAMGIVYAGFDRAMHRDVAIKIMSPEYATSKVSHQRFYREARALASVHHQNIISIYTLGLADSLPYLVMEYVQGSTIEDLVEGIGPLPLEQVVDFGLQIANGLAAAHQRGIIHRDLKPANIFAEAISQRVKIGDFGIACGVDQLDLTEAGALVGSPLFLAPEQIENGQTSASTDLFSLGSVFYYMCTGIYPFAAKSMAAVVRAICEANPLPPSAIRHEIPNWLNDLILELLSRRPEDRPVSAQSLHSRLLAYSTNVAVHAGAI